MVFRERLIANTESVFELENDEQQFMVMNLGPGDVYITFGKPATVDGPDAVLLPEGLWRDFYSDNPVYKVHVISSGTPKVQIDIMG